MASMRWLPISPMIAITSESSSSEKPLAWFIRRGVRCVRALISHLLDDQTTKTKTAATFAAAMASAWFDFRELPSLVTSALIISSLYLLLAGGAQQLIKPRQV